MYIEESAVGMLISLGCIVLCCVILKSLTDYVRQKFTK
jgi:hypothetical protein